ncbi:MAG: hypothetical protein AB1765_03325 [Candidatus Hydrogenedentota bacterium]
MEGIVIGEEDLTEILWDLQKLHWYAKKGGKMEHLILCLGEIQQSIDDVIKGRNKTYRNMNSAILSKEEGGE